MIHATTFRSFHSKTVLVAHGKKCVPNFWR